MTVQIVMLSSDPGHYWKVLVFIGRASQELPASGLSPFLPPQVQYMPM